MAPISFRNSKIVYYGPHECGNCGQLVVKMGFEWGGNTFNHPEGPIYPNTEWHPHVCDPKLVKDKPKPESVPPKPTFHGPTCRGCYALGTACGVCERCEYERNNR